MSLAAHGFPPDLLNAWAGSVRSLNQLQLDAINQYGLLEGENVVVSAPTSSGKTMVGELAALRGILERKRACFLLPLKALVNDKHRQFTRIYEGFGVRVIRATGEISDDIPALMRGHYDVCLLTYEKFASLAIATPYILEQLGTCIRYRRGADDRGRLPGANLEFLLTLLRVRRASGVEPQLIALSAVIGDTHGLERWLGAKTARAGPSARSLLRRGSSSLMAGFDMWIRAARSRRRRRSSRASSERVQARTGSSRSYASSWAKASR